MGALILGYTGPTPTPAMRPKTNILDDLKLAQARRAHDRAELKARPYIDPAQFNKITDQISKDSKTIDELLIELFNVLAWEDPELLV